MPLRVGRGQGSVDHFVADADFQATHDRWVDGDVELDVAVVDTRQGGGEPIGLFGGQRSRAAHMGDDPPAPLCGQAAQVRNCTLHRPSVQFGRDVGQQADGQGPPCLPAAAG